MKTIETILHSFSQNKRSASKRKVRRCQRCLAKEGKPHPARGFLVTLSKFDDNERSLLYCMACRLEILKREAIKKQNPELFEKLKKFGMLTVSILFIILAASSLTIAQPPGLPITPDQAPIDGGLSILAAAGGAYAWKMLKARNREEG